METPKPRQVVVEHYDEVVFSQPQDDFARRVNAANAVGRGPAPYTEITPNCAPPSLSPSLLSETKLDHLSHALTARQGFPKAAASQHAWCRHRQGRGW
jgi:hypothetical protein